MGLKGTIKRASNGQRLTVLFIILSITACAAPTVPPPVPPAPPPEPVAPETGVPIIQFTIQVGAFSTTERAANYADRLQSDGLDAYYFIDLDGFYKVRFGRFDTKAAAQSHATALQAQGVIEAFYIVCPDPMGHAIDHRAILRGNLVKTAHRFIGTPYRWGGESPQSGFDCSGLTMTVYRLNGLDLPRNAFSQFQAGTPVQRGSLQNGDLVFFATGRSGRVSHVGIYSGQDKFIHAPGRGKRIRTASLSNGYFKARYMGARRYF